MLPGRPELGGTERGQRQKKYQTPNVVQYLLKLASFSCPTGDKLKRKCVCVVLMFHDRVGKASLCFIWA